MPPIRLQSGLLAVAVAASLAGCAWSRPPYADDPLLRRRQTPRLLQDLIPTLRSADPGRQADRPTRPVLTEP